MKYKTLFAALLISALLVDAVDAGWRFRRIRIRFRLRRVLKPLCRWACPRVCRLVPIGGASKIVCGFVCSRVCGKKKRQAVEAGHETPLPCYLSFYDMDEDAVVGREEFAAAFQDGPNSGSDQAFDVCDESGDGLLTKWELIDNCSALNFGDCPDANSAADGNDDGGDSDDNGPDGSNDDGGNSDDNGGTSDGEEGAGEQ